MNRRIFLKKPATAGLLFGLSQILLPKMGLADEVTPAPIQLDVLVANNHGHELMLEISQILNLLKQSKESGPINISIKGKSRHNHQLQLSFDDLLNLLLQEQLELSSSTDVGHAHNLTLKLVLTK